MNISYVIYRTYVNKQQGPSKWQLYTHILMCACVFIIIMFIIIIIIIYVLFCIFNAGLQKLQEI